MYKKQLLSVTFLSIVGIQPALAEPTLPWYVGVGAGQNAVSDMDIVRTTTFSGTSLGDTALVGEMGRDPAYTVVLGNRLSDALALEAEYTRRSNSADRVLVSGSAVNNQLKLKADSVMVNAVYSFGGSSSLRPFVGIGLGSAKIEAEVSDSLSNASDSNWEFAYQALIGAEWKFSGRWSLTGQYQYFEVSSPGATPVTSKGLSANVYKLDSYTAQTVSVGLRYSF